MEDTIIALLNNNLRVIIPDFGAFIIRQKQPRIIVFNEFLRYNDGILIDFIVKTEGIDPDIAEQRVAAFAEDGSKLLASGREMVIEGLGSLRKDSSGKISFVEAPEIIEIEINETAEPEKIAAEPEKPETPGFIEKETPHTPKTRSASVKKSKVAKAPAKAKNSPPKKLPKKLPPDIPPTAVDLPIAEPQPAIEAAIEQAAVEPVVPLEEATEQAAVEPVVPMEAAIEQAAVEAPSGEPVVPTELATEPVAVEAASAEPGVLTQEAVDAAVAGIRKEMEPERLPDNWSSFAAGNTGASVKPNPLSTNRILAWVLIILFINAVILGWFVFRKKTQNAPAGKSVTTMISDTLYDQLADSVKAAALDSSIVYGEIPGEDLKESASSPGSRYYIVAGCFRDEVNADSLVTSLKLLGYKAEKFGKIGNLFAVCFTSFDDKDEAVLELKNIREKVPSAWMTKF